MAIEIPNSLMAACLVYPTPGNPAIVALGTPFLANRGFEAYDPTSSAASEDTVRGGFTYDQAGQYLMRTLEGANPLNVVCKWTLPQPGSMVAEYVPPVPEILGPLADGQTLVVVALDSAEQPFDPGGFRLEITKYNEENINALLAAVP